MRVCKRVRDRLGGIFQRAESIVPHGEEASPGELDEGPEKNPQSARHEIRRSF